jgi:predicted membrane-bound mannosyltransferase
MIQIQKVKTMTQAAAFEKKEARRSIYISRFFRGDYLLNGLIRSAVSITIAYGLIIGMLVIYHAEELMTEKSVEDLAALGKEALLWYGILLAGFLAISAVVYMVQYSKAQKQVKQYRSYLRKLVKGYQENAGTKERSL